jgi:hypothetical protein
LNTSFELDRAIDTIEAQRFELDVQRQVLSAAVADGQITAEEFPTVQAAVTRLNCVGNGLQLVCHALEGVLIGLLMVAQILRVGFRGVPNRHLKRRIEAWEAMQAAPDERQPIPLALRAPLLRAKKKRRLQPAPSSHLAANHRGHPHFTVIRPTKQDHGSNPCQPS